MVIPQLLNGPVSITTSALLFHSTVVFTPVLLLKRGAKILVDISLGRIEYCRVSDVI